MEQLLFSTVIDRLTATTIKRCSRWTQKCRFIPDLRSGELKHWSFKYHSWTRELHDFIDHHIVVQKAAQMGLSEWALNIAFHGVDQERFNVLYGLPNQKPDAADFSATRFNPAIESSPYLLDLFNETKNVGLKMAGNQALYIRGSRGSSTFKSIPVNMVILDEVDEMSQEAVAKAKERLSGQFRTFFRELSTPSIDNYGINIVFNRSTQDFYSFKCPHCNRNTNLIFPDCIKITAEQSSDPSVHDSYLICKECKHKLNHDSKPEWLADGSWESTFPNRVIRGIGINQLYSSTVTPGKIAISYIDSQTNPADEQEFYNSKLGLPRIVAGAKIDDNDIVNCIGNHSNGTFSKGLITMGVDVGNHLHIQIIKWRFPKEVNDPNMDAHGQVLFQGKIKDTTPGFYGLDEFMRQYQPTHTVIDAQPEKRSSLAFVNRWRGLATTCYYIHSLNGKDFGSQDDERVTVHRTTWLDSYLGRFLGGANSTRIKIPANTDQEFKNHIKCLVRKYEKDGNGNTTVKYVKGEGEDHYAHAGCYAEIALKIAAQNGISRPIKVKI